MPQWFDDIKHVFSEYEHTLEFIESQGRGMSILFGTAIVASVVAAAVVSTAPNVMARRAANYWEYNETQTREDEWHEMHFSIALVRGGDVLHELLNSDISDFLATQTGKKLCGTRKELYPSIAV